MDAFLISYAGLLGIIWLRYGLIAGGFYALIWMRPEVKVGGTRLAKIRPAPKTLWREVKTSVAVSFIYAVPSAILIAAWKAGGTAITMGPPSAAEWLWMPVSIGLYLFLHDTYFYWTHRFMHLPRFFDATHRTHHASPQPTPFAAFAFHPWEAIISAPLIPLLAFFIPIHIGAFLFVLTLMTFTSVANHAGWEIWPRAFLDGPIGRHLITARHHNLHHTKVRRNYGLYFRFWDRVMGTDDMSGDPMTANVEPAAMAKAA